VKGIQSIVGTRHTGRVGQKALFHKAICTVGSNFITCFSFGKQPKTQPVSLVLWIARNARVPPKALCSQDETMLILIPTMNDCQSPNKGIVLSNKNHTSLSHCDVTSNFKERPRSPSEHTTGPYTVFLQTNKNNKKGNRVC
jgi:hypothetical protein